eukprot:TRINITY_DN3321_c0_g1_i4.p1 TRINITY_DN3321_c0_g1~~TRINITY_DN3321_c0_g1_i4.p1  ORF type:complete len:226 (+),score=68.11 TRINITY_DN3321_c0_g1_i4:255-932(+)
MKSSRDRVTEQWKKEGRSRNNRFEDKEFERDVKKMTQKMIMDAEKSTKRALEIRLANERTEKEEEIKKIQEMKKELEHEKEWDESRTDRVNSWRTFKQLHTLPPDPEEKKKKAALETSTSTASTTPSTTESQVESTPLPSFDSTPLVPPTPVDAPASVVTPTPLDAPTPVAPTPIPSSKTPTPPKAEPKKEARPKPIPMLGAEPPKKKRYAGGPLKPPKVKLFST